MNPIFLWGATLGLLAAESLSARFAAPPKVEIFPDGSVEWRAELDCSEPGALSGALLRFRWDWDFDGVSDAGDSSALNPTHCLSGSAMTRAFRPGRPGLLCAGLEGGGLKDSACNFTGHPGSLLALRRFCARPAGGEPEWVQWENRSALPLDLSKIGFQGRFVAAGTSISLAPGQSRIWTPDTAALRRFAYAAEIFPAPAWKSLRNTGDTLRLTLAGALLDSAIFGASSSEPREACFESGSKSGSVSPFTLAWQGPWRPGRILSIRVEGPVDASFTLRAFDLDGRPRCVLLPAGRGSQTLEWHGCPGLPPRGALLLHLQPRRGPPLRRLLTWQP